MNLFAKTLTPVTLQEWVNWIDHLNTAKKGGLRHQLPYDEGQGYGKALIELDVTQPLFKGFEGIVTYYQQRPYIPDADDPDTVAIKPVKIFSYVRKVQLEDLPAIDGKPAKAGVRSMWAALDAAVDPNITVKDARDITILMESMKADIEAEQVFGRAAADFEFFNE